MKRDVSPKPRGIETHPPEELLRILCEIYPLEIAKELFDKLMGTNEKKGIYPVQYVLVPKNIS